MNFMSFTLILIAVFATSEVNADNIAKHILSDLCGSGTSLTYKAHGVYLRWDDLSDQPEGEDQYTLTLNRDIDCNVTLEVDPEGFSGLAVWSALFFYEEFRYVPANDTGTGRSEEECKGVYMQLYDPADSDTPSWTMCSSHTRPENFESTNPIIKLRFVANFSLVDLGENMTSAQQRDPDHYPQIFFKIVFTTYAPDCDIDKFENLLKCKNSMRCIHTDVVCDRFGAFNCWSPSTGFDISDQMSGSPAYCFEDPLAYLIPLFVILGILGAALVAAMMYWLFWRPGWCPWRLARLRNCHPCRKCCRRGRCGKFCSESNACKCCKSGPANSYSDGGASSAGGGKASMMNGNSANSSVYSGAWVRFCAGDGFHLSEARY